MKHALDVYAGPRAMEILRDRGLQADDVRVLAGASGGPKWISMYGIDRVLMGEFLAGPRTRPIDLIGSSSGAWRMSCYAQDDSPAALDRLAEAYIEQRYPPKPSLDLVSRTCAGILAYVLGPNGTDEILANQQRRLHVVTACCHRVLGTDVKPLLLLGLGLASVANAASRRTLGWWMTRTVFHAKDRHQSPFLSLHDLPTRHPQMAKETVHAALLASGSIPLILEGVRIPQAPWGRHRDGALTDYHLDLDFGVSDGIVLYPHFSRRIIPGWLDKMVRWRRANPRNFERAVLLVPSDDFVSRLPRRKIPDRNDFAECTDSERIRNWYATRDATRELGDELRDLLASGRIADRARPLAF